MSTDLTSFTPTAEAIMALTAYLPEHRLDMCKRLKYALAEQRKAEEWLRNCTADINSECGRLRNLIREKWSADEIEEAGRRLRDEQTGNCRRAALRPADAKKGGA